MDLEFILEQLFRVVKYADFGDEVGRRNVLDIVGMKTLFFFYNISFVATFALLVDELLTNLEVGEAVCAAAIEVLHELLAREDAFTAKIAQVTESLRDIFAHDGNNSAAATGISPDTLHRSLQSMSLQHEQEGDALLTQEIRIMANLKALEVVRLALKLDPHKALDTNYLLLLETLVIPAINTPLAFVQLAGLKCLAQYGIRSKVKSCGLFFLFLQTCFFQLVDFLLWIGTGRRVHGLICPVQPAGPRRSQASKLAVPV